MKKCMSKEKLTGRLGHEFGSGLRKASGYEDTQHMLEQEGITEEALNRTPPVGLNLQILSEMDSIKQAGREFCGRPIATSILGLAIVDGIEDFNRFLSSTMHTTWSQLNIVEIDSEMIDQVKKSTLAGVKPIHKDARYTQIDEKSQDIVLRDHLGNCCPPAIDREIDKETARILKPGGIAIINITTSESLKDSPNRDIVSFKQLAEGLNWDILVSLSHKIYDLTQLKSSFGEQFEEARGKLLEIEESDSFVIFGEDTDGHGEWFRLLSDHMKLWEENGFEIVEVKTREGNDSHVPPLRCKRHNVVLRKK